MSKEQAQVNEDNVESLKAEVNRLTAELSMQLARQQGVLQQSAPQPTALQQSSPQPAYPQQNSLQQTGKKTWWSSIVDTITGHLQYIFLQLLFPIVIIALLLFTNFIGLDDSQVLNEIGHVQSQVENLNVNDGLSQLHQRIDDIYSLADENKLNPSWSEQYQTLSNELGDLKQQMAQLQALLTAITEVRDLGQQMVSLQQISVPKTDTLMRQMEGLQSRIDVQGQSLSAQVQPVMTLFSKELMEQIDQRMTSVELQQTEILTQLSTRR